VAESVVALRIVRVGLAAGLALLAAQSTADLVAALGFHSYDSLVDLDRNNSIPDIVSTGAILCAAAGAAVLSFRATRVRRRAAALTVVLVLVALDDALHVGVDQSQASGKITMATVGIAATLLIGTTLEIPRAASISALAGLGLLTVSLWGGDINDKLLTKIGFANLGRGDVAYELSIVGKQGLELAGWILIALGLWAAAAVAGRASRERRPAPSLAP